MATVKITFARLEYAVKFYLFGFPVEVFGRWPSAAEYVPHECEEEWSTDCARAVEALGNLLSLAGYPKTPANIVEMMRTMPRKLDGIGASASPADSLFDRCSKPDPKDIASLRPSDLWLMAESLALLECLKPSKRNLLEAAVCGVMLGWERNQSISPPNK